MLSIALAALVQAAPPELGLVPWRRGYDAARAEAKKRGVPVLILFNEVPGCSTVNAYADDVLTNPLVIDAAQLFVPVFVSNNEGGGDDRRVLEQFHEPAWNNPVLRIVDANGRALAPRITHTSGAPGLLAAMNAALGDKAPAWLPLVVEAPIEREATYAMYCFWEGEAALGALDEVRATSPGFVDGREVVKVKIAAGGDRRVADVARAHGFTRVQGAFSHAPNDDKHTLARTKLARVPMTETQRARVNAALAEGKDPLVYLSPSQRRAIDDEATRAALADAPL